MKINNAIVSSNNNPQYLEFWPFVAKAWKRIGITPVLVFLHMKGEEDLTGELAKWGEVIPLPLTPSWDIVNQSQCSRLYVATQLEGTHIISDIDMLPLSGEYFNGAVKEAAADALVSYTADVIEQGFYLRVPQYPMCYLAGKGETFKEIIGQFKWEDFVVSFAQERFGYGSDQRVFYKRLGAWRGKGERFITLRRGWIEGRALNRIDKVKWEWTEEQIDKELLYDCHMPRPYSANSGLLDPLLNKIGIL
jgi:hypothetical protein